MHGASQRRQLSDRTNALSHYKRKRLLEKIGFGIHNSRRDARRLRLGALRALASPRTRTTHLTVLHRAYGVLEACLDAHHDWVADELARACVEELECDEGLTGKVLRKIRPKGAVVALTGEVVYSLTKHLALAVEHSDQRQQSSDAPAQL